jgi:multidrug efflux pump subunit AcrB
VAEEVSALARPIAGVGWVRTDYDHPLQAMSLNMKTDEVSRLGYSNTLLAYSLMVGTKGFPISTVWEGDYPVNISLLVDKKIKSNVDEVLNQNVTSPFLLTSVPVRQLADAGVEWTEGNIVRRNGMRTITVRIDSKRGIISDVIFKDLLEKMKGLNLPDGIGISYGGEHEMSVENLNPLGYSMMVSILLTYLILLFQFRKFKTSLVIMLTMPLSIFGAAFGVFVTGYPFGVTAFIGVIGLMGIVVRNGIILVSYAEELRANGGLSVKDAALAAGKRRMRPIFLTSAAAAVGVIPMIMSRSSLWGPLGSVICFGVLFGMILSLFLLPVFYYLVNRKEDQPSVEGESL